jgi:hypothetical protein
LHFGLIRITKKSAIGKTPFELVYGLDVTLPVHLRLPTYQLLHGFSTDKDALQNRLDHLIELDENRRKDFDQSVRNQEKVKKTFDKSSKQRVFQKGDTVCCGIKGKKSQGNMGSLTVCGQDHTSSMMLLG